MDKTVLQIVVAMLAATLVLGASAQGAGDMKFRIGVGSVDPKSDNSAVANVDSGTTLVMNGTYMFNERLGFEVLASLPFTHDIKLASDGSKVGETKHLPPTFSLQYYFPNDSKFTPFIGAGINYTLFFEEQTTGALAGTKLELEDSIGLATQVGFDYDLTDEILVSFDVRWMDIDTDAELDGADLVTVEIDPLIYSLSVGWKF